ncbi:cell division protein ZapE [Jannaschia aquimarina]|uniref:AFG1-like ATPase n=1 Tax=Jannaschia aquimarina TaxID=935700 RepID=A0A0D1EHM2_9RHOB|nr:cell division protein ZapE [Jannaschia aquimarina]KIT16351.1 AFG1-like ATPase [Jannaschia aquimarina]SNT25758.1 cell division protein ZapE [Jannaschia aquimarina]
MTLSDLYERRVAEGTLERDPAQVAALGVLEQVRAKLEEVPAKPKRGLFGRKAKAPDGPMGCYLWGGVGRGKSMLMDLFHEAAPVPSRRAHFHAFMQEVHEGMHEARTRGVTDAIAPVADAVIAEVRVLCFDEMQITDITDAMIVGRLFQRLFDGGVHVVTTSNRVPRDLYKDGLNRGLFVPFIEMIETRMIVHELAADRDYRQERLAGEAVYFTPSETDDMGLDALWEKLSHGISDGLALRVKGRVVELPDFRAGVARASFAELCGRPLGAADYLALASAVRVLILTHVPRLDEAHRNEARRFVTLIDALYEAGVRLIVSAEAEPESLYPEGTGAFEFERTASRLREMQAEGWGSRDG